MEKVCSCIGIFFVCSVPWPIRKSLKKIFVRIFFMIGKKQARIEVQTEVNGNGKPVPQTVRDSTKAGWCLYQILLMPDQSGMIHYQYQFFTAPKIFSQIFNRAGRHSTNWQVREFASINHTQSNFSVTIPFNLNFSV